jgi:hypothetical protein
MRDLLKGRIMKKIDPNMIEETPLIRDQFAKLVLGTVAGFVTSRLVEKGYEVAIKKYRNRNTSKMK